MDAIPPGSWLGLLGGGQLGRMFCMAAQSLGYKVCVLDPGHDSPAGAVADDHIAADYLDEAALAELARRCRAATTEFENVPAAALRFLAQRCSVSPDAASVAIAQDRIEEKRFVDRVWNRRGAAYRDRARPRLREHRRTAFSCDPEIRKDGLRRQGSSASRYARSGARRMA